jgi:hypothetical protein
MIIYGIVALTMRRALLRLVLQHSTSTIECRTVPKVNNITP